MAESEKRPLLDACATEPETDVGNGRRFRRGYGDLAPEHGRAQAVISVINVGPHVFDGSRWKEDRGGALIRPLAHQSAEAIRKEAGVLDFSDEERGILQAGDVAVSALEGLGPRVVALNPVKQREKRELELMVSEAETLRKSLQDRQASRHRHAKSSAGSGKLDNMLTEALPYISREVCELNRDPLAVNCRSGTIKFQSQIEDEPDPDGGDRYSYRAELHPHRPDDLISKCAVANWSAESRAPAHGWHNFLLTVQPDPEMRAFLKRFFGYCLTGLVSEQVMLFFYGSGRNGKSTFVETIAHVLADYSVTLSIDSFSGENKRSGAEATPDLARLPGARLVVAAEPEANVKLKDALIKALTGGEKIPVRRLHKDFFEVDPTFKIILSGNHKPRIDDDSEGIWRRVQLVPWPIQIPPDEVDRLLLHKLRAEADGIFAWMVEGAIEYLTYGLITPEIVRAASKEYREESDPVGTFIRLACEVTGIDDDQEKPLDLFIAYERFAEAEGVFKFNHPTFEKRLARTAGRPFPDHQGKMQVFRKTRGATRIYRGIRLKPEWLPGDYPAPHATSRVGSSS